MATRLTTKTKPAQALRSATDKQRILNVADQIKGSAYVIDEALLQRNGERLKAIQARTGCDITLALKGFSTYHVFPTLKPYLAGLSASSVYEAKLANDFFGKHLHVYSPAYADADIEALIPITSHLIFNSFSQYERFKDKLAKANYQGDIGVRLNPELSLASHDIYDPCAKYSRFGVTKAELCPALIREMDGIHVHALCQQFSGGLDMVMRAVEDKFGRYLSSLSWVNFGGGHHLTHPDYDVDYLCDLITRFQNKYKLKVILEPGEAVVYQTGYFVSTVVDTLRNEIDIAILEGSAKAHTPDILELNARHSVIGASEANKKAFTYRLGGITCQANDVFGDYAFDAPLKAGDKVIFEDMAQYTMVKNTFFNGVRMPSIYALDVSGKLKLLKTFSYEDFLGRC